MKNIKIISNFIFKRSYFLAIIWALVLWLYTFSKVDGYISLYPHYYQRLSLAKSMATTSNLSILVGPAKDIQTIGGYLIWSSLMIVIYTVAAWIITTTSKQLSDNEYSTRFDLVFSFGKNLKSITFGVLCGILKSILVFGLIFGSLIILMGKMNSVNLAWNSLIPLILAILVLAIFFELLTALVSQFVESKRNVNLISLFLLGVFYIIKAIADSSSAKWLLNFSPLGWIEKMNLLLGNDLVWFVPFIISILVLITLIYYISLKRSISESIIKPKLEYKSNIKSLRNILTSEIRFKYKFILIWSSVIFLLDLMYGMLTKTALNIIDKSTNFKGSVSTFGLSPSQNNLNLYISVILYLNMLIISFFAASYLSNIYRDELNGQSTMLIQYKNRIKILLTKGFVHYLGLIFIWIAIFLGFSLGLYINKVSSLDFNSLILGSLKILLPEVLVFSLGIFIYGVIARFTNWISFGFLGLSILLSLLVNSLKLNHYLIDLSIFSHIKIYPLRAIDNHIVWVFLGASLVFSIAAILAFKKRDLIFS